jgi:hypothetical protein
VASLVTLDQLAQKALRLTDLENATTRFPTGTAGSEAYVYVNEAYKHVYAAILQVEDRPFFATETKIQLSTPAPLGDPMLVSLPLDYLQLLGIGWSSGQMGPWDPIDPYQDEGERLMLLSPGFSGGDGRRFRYGFSASPTAVTQSTVRVIYSLELVPPPPLASWLRLRYVPVCPDLINPTDTIDSMLGQDELVATWAAILMRRKDDLETGSLEADYARHMSRLTAIARRRDRSRPPKTAVVRGWGRHGYGRMGRRF